MLEGACYTRRESDVRCRSRRASRDVEAGKVDKCEAERGIARIAVRRRDARKARARTAVTRRPCVDATLRPKLREAEVADIAKAISPARCVVARLSAARFSSRHGAEVVIAFFAFYNSCQSP